MLFCALFISGTLTIKDTTAAINSLKTNFREVSISHYDSKVGNITENILEHNNGKPIESNVFKENDDGGNNLFAVYLTNENGIPCETYYFSNKNVMTRDELIGIVNRDESEQNASNHTVEKNDSEIQFVNSSDSTSTKISSANVTTLVSVTPTTYIRKYNWSFYDYGVLQATLVTSATLTRQTSNANFNGSLSSVWDVVTTSQLSQVNAIRLNDQYTRLDVSAYNAEELIDYGPIESTSGGSLSVGLDGAGVPSLSYSFSISGFSVTNLSSMINNYGRWRFWDGFGNEPEFTTKPGIRVVNTQGNLVVNLSHSTNIKTYLTGIFINTTHNTGVIQMVVSDR